MAPASFLSSYEALNVYCPEYDLSVATEFRDGNVNPGSVATEFRDGNVNPGYGQLEQLQEVLSHLYFAQKAWGAMAGLIAAAVVVGSFVWANAQTITFLKWIISQFFGA